jgi:hypothetical protein
MLKDEKRTPDPELRKLYPELSDAELIVAEDKLTEYLEFALRVYRRIVTNPDAYRDFRVLRSQKKHFRIDHEGSNGYENSPHT